VLAQPNGWCFGCCSPALDTKRGLLYYSLQDLKRVCMMQWKHTQCIYILDTHCLHVASNLAAAAMIFARSLIMFMRRSAFAF
jgi:hypothetical protein